MIRTLVRKGCNLISSPQFHLNQSQFTTIPRINLPKTIRFFSNESNSSDQNPTTPPGKVPDFHIQDVSTQELKSRVKKYFEGDEEALPSIFEAILSRKFLGKHEDKDDEIAEKLRFTPVEEVDYTEVESDSEEAHETDDDVVDESEQKEHVTDTRVCEEILEDMLHFDKLLPEDIKQKTIAKLDELAKKVEQNELGDEEAYEQFKAFEDEIVTGYVKKDEEERLIESDEVVVPVDKKSDDPPGVGPILRWQTRVVFAQGGDAWHPKNRRVKLKVTVKELGLSKYQFRRMREIVGTRYHPGKDELSITSERFEHREENRKDCLRTLLNIIEEAGKADTLIDEARTTYVKERLKANPEFMARLHAKTKQAPPAVPA